MGVALSDSEYSVSSKRPYLIRAMHEWMSDNGHTPHLVVDALHPSVVVPQEHIKDGRIVLNVSYTAAHALQLENHQVTFRARFGGRPFDVSVPVASVLGIYARETGQGMVFSDGSDQDDPDPSDSADRSERGADGKQAPKPSHLKIVK